MKTILTEQTRIRMIELAGLKQEVEKAKLEIDQMDISGLFRQVSDISTNRDYENLASIIRSNIERRMPTFAKLFPEVVSFQTKGTGVSHARYDYKGKILHGITLTPLLPMMIHLNTDNIEDIPVKERLKKLVDSKLNKQ